MTVGEEQRTLRIRMGVVADGECDQPLPHAAEIA
jgi:hypothetical protein